MNEPIDNRDCNIQTLANSRALAPIPRATPVTTTVRLSKRFTDAGTFGLRDPLRGLYAPPEPDRISAHAPIVKRSAPDRVGRGRSRSGSPLRRRADSPACRSRRPPTRGARGSPSPRRPRSRRSRRRCCRRNRAPPARARGPSAAARPSRPRAPRSAVF